jgi:DNA-binding MarR family transcriptional regulator
MLSSSLLSRGRYIYRVAIISRHDVTPTTAGATRGGDAVLLKKAERLHHLHTEDYARLARFRHAIRQFVRFSEDAAASVGLTTQHYQAMLILRACPEGEAVTINDLARELFIKHNSAVGLVDRLVEERLVERAPSRTDRRKVELRLSARGRRVLAKLASVHREELHRIGPLLGRVIRQASAR